MKLSASVDLRYSVPGAKSKGTKLAMDERDFLLLKVK
jgi:hypothetical protein